MQNLTNLTKQINKQEKIVNLLEKKYKKAKKEFRMNIELDGIEMQISQVEYFSSKIILKALKSTLLQITELDCTINYLK
tara:strand:+ start:52 stop:288 length:237 start_codon:yes stop_codon:yes gene_type:complete